MGWSEYEFYLCANSEGRESIREDSVRLPKWYSKDTQIEKKDDEQLKQEILNMLGQDSPFIRAIEQNYELDGTKQYGDEYVRGQSKKIGDVSLTGNDIKQYTQDPLAILHNSFKQKCEKIREGDEAAIEKLMKAYSNPELKQSAIDPKAQALQEKLAQKYSKPETTKDGDGTIM